MDAGRRVRTNMRKTNTENRHRIFLGVAHIIFFIDIILVYSRCRHEQFEHMENPLSHQAMADLPTLSVFYRFLLL